MLCHFEIKFSRDPLGFLIEQDRIEAEEHQAQEENYYRALHEYMNEQIIKVHTIKRVMGVIMTPFNELLEWLAITPDGLRTEDFARLLYNFFESVNETRKEIKEGESKPKSSKHSNWSPGRPSVNPDLMSDLTAKLTNSPLLS